MSEPDPFPETAGRYSSEVCPFLGVVDDPQTAMSFPSPGNFCHRTRPYGTPNLDFQRSFCFSEEYTNCPVFTRSGRAPLPAELRFQAAKAPVGKRVILPLLVGGMVVLLGIIAVLWGMQIRSKHGGGQSGLTGSLTPPPTEVSLSTAAFHFTDTPAAPTIETATRLPPTLAVLPTSTATPTLQSTSTDIPFTPTASPTKHFIPSHTPTITFIIFENTPIPADTAVPPTEAAPTATSAPIATSPPGG